LLIFPEGTRSEDGQMKAFKPTAGYLALQYNVDVLPVYLDGTFEAFPKGSWWPKFRKLEVRIGAPIEVAPLAKALHASARSERYRVVTQVCEDAVRALSKGEVLKAGDVKASISRAAVRSTR
jgi:long-chain acyl-CoA synthetase